MKGVRSPGCRVLDLDLPLVLGTETAYRVINTVLSLQVFISITVL